MSFSVIGVLVLRAWRPQGPGPASPADRPLGVPQGSGIPNPTSRCVQSGVISSDWDLVTEVQELEPCESEDPGTGEPFCRVRAPAAAHPPFGLVPCPAGGRL